MAQGISIREFARLDGCDEKLVRRKISSEHLTQFEDKTLDPALVGTDWRARTYKRADTPADEEDDDDGVRDYDADGEAAARLLEEGGPQWSHAEADRRRLNYVALRGQINYDREMGLVVEVADVVQAVVNEYALVRNKLLNVGSRLAGKVTLAKSSAEVKAIIDKEIAAALEELTLDGQGFDSAEEREQAIRERFAEPS